MNILLLYSIYISVRSMVNPYWLDNNYQYWSVMYFTFLSASESSESSESSEEEEEEEGAGSNNAVLCVDNAPYPEFHPENNSVERAYQEVIFVVNMSIYS